jgi:hypothetical protein
MNLKEDFPMYLDYQEIANQCQTILEESQQFWEKQVEMWEQIGQEYLNDIEAQIDPGYQEQWGTQAFKESFAVWEKGWHYLLPWFQSPFSIVGGFGFSEDRETSKKIEALSELQAAQKLEIERQIQLISEHKNKITELTKQITLLKKDITSQKQTAKSQTVELEAFKDNLGLQEKSLAACEAQLKNMAKTK